MGSGCGFLIVDGEHGIDAVYEKPHSISTMPLFNIHRSVIISGSGFIVIVVHRFLCCGFKRAEALFVGIRGILDRYLSFYSIPT